MTDDRDLEELLTRRWTCRAYLPDALPRETIERMLTLAQRTPSWSNTQPWQVYVTGGDETERFREAMVAWAQTADEHYDYGHPESFPDVLRERRRATARQLYESVGIAWGDRAASAKQAQENFRFFGAPHVAIVTAPAELGTYGAVDAGAYITCLLLAAEALGLGATAQAAIAGHSERVRAFFDMPENLRVVAAVSFGLPDLAHPVNQYRTHRATLDEAVVFRGA
ncbi:nitroreductase family protein [Microbacterium sp. No. 7]|uniref:nitroreductase family protein n=1 Tax=Microbacterium sp. No. 7 TaxID=1714373 RepID=UPI0006D1F96F|nr:nitroreductase family protein [Microbacterium sp. No. 7]ALJ22257.1 nitroreductase [Microbacterium sp. No. 7]